MKSDGFFLFRFATDTKRKLIETSGWIKWCQADANHLFAPWLLFAQMNLFIIFFRADFEIESEKQRA